MFDINGNIAINNSTHFLYKINVFTSREIPSNRNYETKIIDICKNKIKIFIKDFKLKDVMQADEAFVIKVLVVLFL